MTWRIPLTPTPLPLGEGRLRANGRATQQLLFELRPQKRQVGVVAAQVPEVQSVAHPFALGPGRREGVEALGDGPPVQFEVDIDDGHFRATPAPPIHAAGRAHRQVEQAPGFVAFAGAAQDHFAAAVQDAFDDLRRGRGGGGHEVAERHDVRERRTDGAEVDGDINLLAQEEVES